MAPKENLQVTLGQVMHTAYIFCNLIWEMYFKVIDSFQNKVSADQYHMAVQAKKRSPAFRLG